MEISDNNETHELQVFDLKKCSCGLTHSLSLSTSKLGAEFLLLLSQSPCSQTLLNLSLWCNIAPFEHDILDQMEVFPVLR